MRLSAIDRMILNSIQEDIPLDPRPFKVLAERAGIGETEFLERVTKLKEEGIIRKYAAGLDHRKLGFKSTLFAFKVPEGELDEIVDEIIKYREVTHCYLREGEYNLWVVFIYKDGEFEGFLEKLTTKIGEESTLNLRTIRQFKLRTNLKI